MYIQKNKWTTAKKHEYSGSKYDSGFEASYARDLDLLVKAKKIIGWDRQVKIQLDVNGYHICNYYIDFKVYHKDKTIEYVETKGYATDVWKMKWKLFEALYGDLPDVVLTVVKQRNNFTLRKLKKVLTKGGAR